MAGPLEGVRVLELTRVGPGAFCTVMMADMGAEVLKIEPPPSGALRGSGASPGPDEAHALATSFTNRNKRSLTLDLKAPEGQEVLHALVREYDVLVEGFRPGVMERLGGGYERLREVNPRLVYCALSGFGQDGPYRDRPAHDLNFLALAGVLDLIGEPDRPPAIPLNIVADFAGASLHGFAGVLLALYARERTGRGQLVDVSYLDTTIALLAATPVVRDYFSHGETPARGKGVFAGRHAYYGTYPTRDGKQITVACTEPWLWSNFCDLVERPALKELGMKAGDFSRPAGEAHAAARAELEALFLTRDRDEWYELLVEADVCAGKVYSVPESYADPQVRHRQMALELEHPEAGAVTQAGVAIKLSETPGGVRSFAPHLGQHTDEVLRSLGYGEGDVARLRERRVV